MKTESTTTQTPPAISHSPKTVRAHYSRRERRAHLHNENPYRNDRKPKGSNQYMQMMQRWNDQAIHIPRHTKLKGWQKEARRNNRKAA